MFIRILAASLLLCLTLVVVIGQSRTIPVMPRPSQRAWHRVALFGSNVGDWPAALPDGVSRARVLLAASRPGFDRLVRWLTDHGAAVEFTDRRSGYLRAVIRSEDLAALIARPDVEQWQLAGPADNLDSEYYLPVATPFASAETAPRRVQSEELVALRAEAAAVAKAKLSEREVIRRELTEQYPYQSNRRMGVDRLLQQYPTFDGRGVTIAIIESGATGTPVGHPLLATALTLDGREVRKVAMIDIATDFAPEGAVFAAPVTLSAPLTCRSILCTWAEVPYLVPSTGIYRLGLWSSAGLGKSVAVLKNDSGMLWIDTNGDREFTHEVAIRDFNTCEDTACGSLTLPNGDTYVYTDDVDGRGVLLHRSQGSHALMTATVAAGRPSGDSYGLGVAPAARIVLVGTDGTAQGIQHSLLEGVIRAARVEEVDVLSVSADYWPLEATTDGFAALMIDRVTSAYGKPVVFAANNNGGGLATEPSPTPSTAFSVGSLALADVAKVVSGVAPTKTEWIPFATTRGPTSDGALRPDFVVPNQRVAGAACRDDRPAGLLAEARLPRCYAISGGTSAAAPTTAGLLALLVGGLKQSGRAVEPNRLLWAMRASTVALPDVPLIAQGLGVPQVDVAWKLYTGDVPWHRILVEAPVRHVMDTYLTDRDRGAGLFEREGWAVGRRASRTIMLQRLEGPAETSAFRLKLRGDAEAFRVPDAVQLPRDVKVPLTISIEPRRVGVHSAVIDVYEAGAAAPIAFVPLTVVVGEPLTTTPSVHAGEIGPDAVDAVLSHVPAGSHMLRLDLEVTEGAVRLGTDLPAGRYLSAPPDLMPYVWTLRKGVGQYTLLMPEPEEGVWAWSVGGESQASSKYRLALRRADVHLQWRARPDERTLNVQMRGRSRDIERPELRAEVGSIVEQERPFQSDWLSTVVEIVVPSETKTMIVQAEAISREGRVEIALYDCTSGHCVFVDDRVPAKPVRQIRVTRPTPGVWKAIASPGPTDSAEGHFKLKTILTNGQADVKPNGAQLASWTVSWSPSDNASSSEAEGSPILFLGLLDRAAEDAERLHPMGSLDQLTNRPAFVATDLVPLPSGRTVSAPAQRP